MCELCCVVLYRALCVSSVVCELCCDICTVNMGLKCSAWSVCPTAVSVHPRCPNLLRNKISSTLVWSMAF